MSEFELQKLVILYYYIFPTWDVYFFPPDFQMNGYALVSYLKREWSHSQICRVASSRFSTPSASASTKCRPEEARGNHEEGNGGTWRG